jgi:energy-coupling factor transporter ATP-binding protein EcfA2
VGLKQAVTEDHAEAPESFKSLFEVDIDLGRVIVFIGANGSGKSSLLEALGALESGSRITSSIFRFPGFLTSSVVMNVAMTKTLRSLHPPPLSPCRVVTRCQLLDITGSSVGRIGR